MTLIKATMSRLLPGRMNSRLSLQLAPWRRHESIKSVEDYESKWITFFRDQAYDQFELQRGLNHCFSHDIVPTIPILEAALRTARKLNDLAAAMRVFGALREKCKDDREYSEYVKYLEPIKQELGISAPEDFGRL